MKAARINSYGHANAIRISDVAQPELKDGQVLVQVCASSINPVDTSVREGQLTRFASIDPPFTLGFDLAGKVVAVGHGVSEFKKGDDVYGQASVLAGGSGAFAEFATTRSGLIGRMPSNVSYVEAASLALTGTSALEALQEQLKLRPNQRILIHGGSGGIGSVAIQIARNIGAYVICTATGDGLDFVKQLGCDECIDYKKVDFDDEISDCDCVLDTVGGETYRRSFEVLREGGTIVSMLEPPDPEAMRRYNVTAIFLLTNVTTPALDTLRKLVESGVVTPHIDRTYKLEEIQEAFLAKERGRVHGKIGVAVML
jgi:NADPH:quinone reductase-like Zn-dependent oxidoreductase